MCDALDVVTELKIRSKLGRADEEGLRPDFLLKVAWIFKSDSARVNMHLILTSRRNTVGSCHNPPLRHK